MTPAPGTVRVAVGLAAAALFVAACGDVITDTDSGVETGSAVSTPSEPAATDPPFSPATVASTTAAETATPAPDTAGASAPEPGRSDLVLRSNGVGTADFGRPDVEVITYVGGILGTPTSDQLAEYPTFDDASGVYVNVEEDAFAYPFSRANCYDNRFCVYFGGETSDALAFVGWSQESFELLSDPLQTLDGITIGSRQSEHADVITVNQGGCFSNGTGETAGILLFVTSEGEPFEYVDDAGDFVQGNPDPSDIVVRAMESGDRPFFLFADC